MIKNKGGFIFSLFIILLGVFSLSCDRSEKRTQKPIISVSILPQKYFVEKISGDKFSINVLIPSGASPASYEPSPHQIKQLEESAIYLKTGELGFERTWISNLEKKLSNTKFYNTSKGIELLETELHQHEGHNHATDPHVWVSPKNVKIIANNIFQAISSFDPENIEFYKTNLRAFEKELDSIDGLIHDKLKLCTQKRYIIYHPALTYFARDYELIQLPLELEGKEPGFRHMQEIIDIAKENNVQLIFVQKEFNTNEAKTLEKEINGKIVIINPLDYNWDKQILFIAEQFINHQN